MCQHVLAQIFDNSKNQKETKNQGMEILLSRLNLNEKGLHNIKLAIDNPEEAIRELLNIIV